ncbi:SLC13 family permease [Pseudodonghicola flavimaris]|uniref:SLC13 family permease n=1 Tax=Pseudodonghicola flavimaris TaxID=3050036 RepID=A0ABT7F5J9_9RHOB|nr:SLC13 family permease [Pseudodonghicola flavimaris]MDK3019857.1 SLC13 family permease [Pseudodonghicola flavimaris]
MRYFKELIIIVIALVALAVSLSLPGGLNQSQALTFGVVLLTLGLWATGIVPAYVGSAFFFTTLLLLDLAPPTVVFSGFSSTAIWLVVTGFVIGAAITHSGLGARIGTLARPHLSHSYAVLIAGLMLIGAIMGFLMPSSMGRAAVLVPVGMALADVLGLDKGSKGRTGVAVVIAFGTNMPSFGILPSNIPNVVMAGVAERTLGLHFSYADYLLLHYPVLGIVKSIAIVLLVLLYFPAKVTTDRPAPGFDHRPGAARRQLALLGILLVTVALWATDQMHGLNPAWIGLATSLVLLTPQTGFVPPKVFKGAVDFGVILFISGALALGAVVTSTGLGPIVAHHVTALLPLQQGQDFLNFLSISTLGILTGVFTTMAGLPAVLTPIAQDLSNATGLPLETVVMTQVIGFSTVFFPYQIGPLIVAMGLAGESTRPLLKMTLSLVALTFLIFIPLDYLWWRLLGMF